MNQTAQADSTCITIVQPPKSNTLLHWPVFRFHGSCNSEPYMLYRHLLDRRQLDADQSPPTVTNTAGESPKLLDKVARFLSAIHRVK